MATYLQLCCGSYLTILTPLIWGIAGYAYNVNAQLPDDDPKKRDFEPGAIILAPFTLPFLAVAVILSLIVCAILSIVRFVILALVYGLFLIITVISLITVRISFLIWLRSVLLKFGNYLLEANTVLIRLFADQVNRLPQPMYTPLPKAR